MKCIEYSKLNKLEKEIVDSWKKACVERDQQIEECLSFKWYHFFIPGYMEKFNKKCEDSHKRWVIYFDLMVKGKII